jgi:nitrate/TMAO reductase-like tetraheme cytochrome c subunit
VSDTFTCDACHRTFPKDISDEEAMAEATAIFGEIPPEERAVVCDDCWKALQRWHSAPLN